ncbi:HalOD1 output domain-containing protein [Halorubrum sp. ASP1]|uniref:HalOD1 output domain-containing protein n=1 Tax=Halorubrum sp. ASP1 TaxID=2518114 RepID=UPI003743057A
MDVVDSDALDELIAGKETEGYIQFEFSRCLVTVESDGSDTVEIAVDTNQKPIYVTAAWMSPSKKVLALFSEASGLPASNESRWKH